MSLDNPNNLKGGSLFNVSHFSFLAATHTSTHPNICIIIFKRDIFHSSLSRVTVNAWYLVYFYFAYTMLSLLRLRVIDPEVSLSFRINSSGNFSTTCGTTRYTIKHNVGMEVWKEWTRHMDKAFHIMLPPSLSTNRLSFSFQRQTNASYCVDNKEKEIRRRLNT